MRHVVKAWHKMPVPRNEKTKTGKHWIEIENADNTAGVAPVVKFTIQSDPVSEVGVNGCQAVDMLEYVKCLFESLNEAFPCTENDHTINHIWEALVWQKARTNDRIKRGVEGKNLQ